LPFLRAASSKNYRYLDLKNWSISKKVLPFVLQYKLSKKKYCNTAVNTKFLKVLAIWRQYTKSIVIAILLVLQY